ncbi:MAG: LysR family transcriptional regulator [Beijerinckiaceae bacterium]|nr:MAG: LysR family transcriptional regulator [Beijerinckiaceae bacterium]
MDRLTSMSVFAKAVEAGSFSAAGQALSMSSQLVGKHVRLLEEQLGIQLLNRTTRRQSLTDAGRNFYERVQHILAEIEAAEALAEESRAVPRGRLRINAPVTFGAHELSKTLPDYLAQFPEIAIELTLTDRMVDLVDEGFDAVFRVGALPDSGLIARQLRPYEFMLCAAPAYLAKHGTPNSPDDLRNHACLGFASGQLAHQWRFVGPEGPTTVAIKSRFVVNNGQALLTAAVAGLGLIFQSATLLRADVIAKRLVQLLPDYQLPARPMHLLYAPDRRITPKLRSFIDFAATQFE